MMRKWVWIVGRHLDGGGWVVHVVVRSKRRALQLLNSDHPEKEGWFIGRVPWNNGRGPGDEIRRLRDYEKVALNV